MKRALTIWCAAALLAAAACDQKPPTGPSTVANSGTPAATPSSTSGSGEPVSGVESLSITAPTLVSPDDGTPFKNSQQPLTLVVRNSVSTSKGTLTYRFEVAYQSDTAFTSPVYTKDGVAQGGNGQTSLTIDKIPAKNSYVWRARAIIGGRVGPPSKLRGFTIGPAVTLDPPAGISPAPNGTVASAPVLTVANARQTGPGAVVVVYRFELSDSPAFGNLLFVADNVPEGSGGQPGQTSVQVTTPLGGGGGNRTYYWRVRASDPADGITTDFSAVFAFTFQAFDPRSIIMHDSPIDFGFWVENSTITSIAFNPVAFEVDFDKRTGPFRYGDVGFGTGSLQYCLGMCVNLGGQWHCSAPIQFWFGRELTASTPPYYVGRNWFYDARWGPLQGYQPQPGEVVALFICPGNCRDVTDGSRSIAKERSNFALVPWSFGDPPVTYVYSNGSYIPSSFSRRVVAGSRK